MYSSVEASKLQPRLRAYLESAQCRGIQFDKKHKCYKVVGADGREVLYAGLIGKLKQLFYPHYKDTRRKSKTQKKGSTAKLGKRIDDEICKVTASKKGQPLKLHQMTTRLLHSLLKEQGHILQAAQVPVQVRPLLRITQADFITLHAESGELHMWELKTGYTPGMYTTTGKGTFKGSHLEDVKCSKYGIWELQRYWTCRALQDAGVPIAQSHVINVYEDTKKKKVVVKVLDNLEWTTRLDTFGVKPQKKRLKT